MTSNKKDQLQNCRLYLCLRLWYIPCQHSSFFPKECKLEILKFVNLKQYCLDSK